MTLGENRRSKLILGNTNVILVMTQLVMKLGNGLNHNYMFVFMVVLFCLPFDSEVVMNREDQQNDEAFEVKV